MIDIESIVAFIADPWPNREPGVLGVVECSPITFLALM